MARRLRRLPHATHAGLAVRVARSPLARLLGLALMRRTVAAPLLLPRTASVHTCGMRFELDLVWLDARGSVLRVDRAVAPWRMRRCRGAAAVIEIPAAAP